MAYFTFDDHLTLVSSHTDHNEVALQSVYQKFQDLHKSLYSQIRNYNLQLYPQRRQSGIVSFESAANPAETQTMALLYLRSASEAQMVERLMGRETVDFSTRFEPRFHPVIELRLTPQYFTIELIMSPDAWWDQQNLVGKLSLKRHRVTFQNLLREMDGSYCLGFWDGVQLSDMYVTTGDLRRGHSLDAWMSTFEEGRDWFRMGMWYAPEDPALDEQNIVSEAFSRVKGLYRIYNFLLWSSNNNYQTRITQPAAYMA